MRWRFTVRKKPKKAKLLVEHVEGDPAKLPEGILQVQGRQPDAPRRVPSGIEITDDPELIEWTRRAYEEHLDRLFETALRRVRAGDWIDLEFRRALARRADLATEGLLRIMSDPQVSTKGRAHAAQVLGSLGRPEGQEFLVAALEALEPEESLAALDVLFDYYRDARAPRARIDASVLRLLRSTSPEVSGRAAHLCECWEVPDAEAPLRQAVLEGRAPLPDLAEALARRATSPESVQAALPHLFTRQAEYTNTVSYWLEHLLDHSDPAIREPFSGALRESLLKYPDQDRLGQHWALDFGRVAMVEDVGLLEQIVARASDPVSRAYALEGLARLQPERAVDRVLAEIRTDGPFKMLVDLLRKHATEGDVERIAALLWPDGRDASIDYSEACLLLEGRGRRGREFVIAHSDQLDEHAREWVAWKLEGLDVRAALADLHAAGVLHVTPDELLQQTEEHRTDEALSLDTTDPSLLTCALDWTGRTILFDTETSQIPCDHDELILQFARASGGKFTPEYPIQIWHRAGEGDYDAPYTVQFIWQDCLFRFCAENYGDYYDVEAVVNSLNAALEHAAIPERYIGLYRGVQFAHYFFADPAAFVPIAEKYRLPLSQDPSDAMRAGRAFEQRVFSDYESPTGGPPLDEFAL